MSESTVRVEIDFRGGGEGGDAVDEFWGFVCEGCRAEFGGAEVVD